MHGEPQVLQTSSGAVEVLTRGGRLDDSRPDDRRPDDEAPILYFHGGHESAAAVPASELYVELGHRVVCLSRPGYGRTAVGALSPAAFAAVVDETRALLAVERFTAVVGTSFGGPQAVEYAGRHPDRTGALILHSAAPSTLPYPDSAAQRRFGPLMFHPAVERYVWAGTGLLLRRAPQVGLRLMMTSLSTQPVSTWLPELDESDRQAMRDALSGLRSGRGFVIDLAHAGEADRQTRRAAQERVACPALITASRRDGGVAWAHAEDFAATIGASRLAELDAPSHLFWIGRPRVQVLTAVRDFLCALPG